MCVEIPRTGLVFARQSIWGVTCLGLFSKWMFCYLSPWKPHKWVLKPSEEGSFLLDNQFEGSHAYIYLKNEHFPIYLLGNPNTVCWNPQNRAFLSKMIDLRGNMPRFTLKNECFPIYLLGNCKNVCWPLVFPQMINVRGHIPMFTLKMNVFPSIFLATA